MTFTEINALASRLPPSPLPEANRRPVLFASADMPPLAIKEAVLTQFLYGYTDLAFGWRAARRLADAQAAFPLFPSGRMHWVYLAWLFFQDQERYCGHPRFRPLIDAYLLNASVDGRPSREALNAMLITSEATLEEVARRSGMPLAVVDAYEALFFNVLDRREDHMFLRNLVYPHSRMEEMLEGYFDKGNMGQILLRMGYNKTIDEVLYFAGFRSSYGADLNYADAVDAFQTQVMTSGVILASNGFLMHRKQHVTINSARGIVQAGKIGGQEVVGGEAGGSLGDALSSQLAQDGRTIRAALGELS